MRLIHVDDLSWPVVVTTFNGQQTDEDVEHYMRRMDSVRARREPFVALSVMREYSNNLSHLRRLGTWAKANNRAEVEYCQGSGIVLPSTSARFLISAFFLMVVPPYPMVAFDDLTDAIAWVMRRLAEVGLSAPTTLASTLTRPL